jgi:GTP:adenosylcobinamide-phosphate guanylyltransferase
MKNLHIIVQAGGRGSRLRHHTWNKPKCLVSVRGKPLLYHLFNKFPKAHFHIIGDYAFDQLETYLAVNPPTVQYNLIQTTDIGTLSGIATALKSIDQESELILTWSDLIIGKLPTWPIELEPTVCTTTAFTCRWTYQDGQLKETPGPIGIPGLFYFKKASLFPTPPQSGEFVKWFSQNILNFKTLECNDLEELGDFSTIELQNDRAGFSRFFNEVTVLEDIVIKKAIDNNYKHLIADEISWYKSITDLGFRRIPKIISEETYTMERIKGQHAYQMQNLTDREKGAVLADYLDALISLHDLGTQPSIDSEIKKIYIDKTIARVESVSKIIPNFNQRSITVNGKKCENIFTDYDRFNDIQKYLNPKIFTPIHGDPTFSNTIIDKNLRTWFIDPRGSFAKPGIWGDPMYDFAKVYYSAIGGYDHFNRQKFKLHVDKETVEVLMEEPSFAKIGEDIFFEFFGKDKCKIEILHGLIWLSLSGYAKDNIDSVIGSFYLGLYWLEKGIEKL